MIIIMITIIIKMIKKNKTFKFLIWSLEIRTLICTKLLAELRVLAKRERSSLAKKIWLSIHQRNFGNHVTVRPTVCSSASQGNQCEMSHILASVGAYNVVLHIQVVVNWQLTIKISADQYHVPILRVRHIEVTCFFEVVRREVTSFQLIASWTPKWISLQWFQVYCFK